MKDRPILFNAAMVRALLDGSKTQTRRVGKLQSDHYVELAAESIGHATKGHVIQATYAAFPGKGTARWAICECPYGQPGDRLWVREAWRSVPMFCLNDGKTSNHVEYAAGKRVLPYGKPPAIWDVPKHRGMKWSPSIHMFRKDSRITLEITGVRVERLQDISEADCIAEGCAGGHGSIPGYGYAATPLEHYNWLWNSINGKGAWETNPWVWAVEFRRVES